jgi:transcription initiation factor TFIIIB Brf1 subunit/transcription initiation factor TFIIB
MYFVRNPPPDDCSSDVVFSSRHAEIAAVAYSLAHARGFTPGHEIEDWLAAEREVDARRNRAAR